MMARCKWEEGCIAEDYWVECTTCGKKMYCFVSKAAETMNALGLMCEEPEKEETNERS